MRQILCLLSLLALAAGGAGASTLLISGFDNPPSGGFTTVFAGSTIINPWTVTGHSVDWINTYWQPQAGNGSLDLAGNAPGGVKTSLITIPGQLYMLSFYLAGNPDGGPTVKEVNVSAGNLNQNFTFNVTGHTRSAMGWEEHTAYFTGTGSDTLAFTDTNQTRSPYGPALDSIRVEAVPEPATLGLAGIGLLVAGLIRKRR